jgi:hypothetical protein
MNSSILRYHYFVIGSTGGKPGSSVQNNQYVPTMEAVDIDYLRKLQVLRSIVPYIILIFGILGNMGILWVFIRKRLRSKSMSSYNFCFCALAIADTAALILMFTRAMINLQVVTNMSLSCKLVKFFYYTCLEISSWTLVLLTLDRIIAVFFVFKYDYWSKKRYAVILFFSLVGIIIAANSHLLVFVGSGVKANIDLGMVQKSPLAFKSNYSSTNNYLSNRTTLTTTSTTTTTTSTTTTTTRVAKAGLMPFYVCNVDERKHPFYYRYFYSKWDTIHAIVYGVVPFLIIFIGNILIIFKLTVFKNTKNITRTSISSKTGSTASLERVETSFKSRQITIMLLSVAFVFLLFTSPLSIYMMVFYDNLDMRESKKEFIRAILRFLGYCNNAVNFYVYFAFSSGFRVEFINCVKSLFGCKPLKSGLCTTSSGSNNDLNEDKKTIRKPIYKARNEDDEDKNENDEQEDDANEDEILLNFNRLSENMRLPYKLDEVNASNQSIKSLHESNRKLSKDLVNEAVSKVARLKEMRENQNDENQVFINRVSTHV